MHKLCALHLLFIIYFVINKYAFGQTFPFFNHTYDNHILNKKFKSAYTSHLYRLIKQIDKVYSSRKYDFSSSLWIRNDPFNREARHGGIIAIGASWQIQSKLSNFRPRTPHASQRNITAIFFSGERWLKLSRDFQGINNGSRPFYDNRREKQTKPRASGPVGSRRHQSERASRAP